MPGTGIDFDAIVTVYGVAPARLRSLVTRSAVTGFPAAGPDGQWSAEEVELWMGELVPASQIAGLLELKRAQTVFAYEQQPGYFVEPDLVETTNAGRKQRRWRRAKVLAWDAKRPGRGNPEPRKPRSVAEVPADVDVSQATLSSSEAAAVLGYASISSFTSAHAQGQLPQLGEPGAPEAGPGRPSRRWDTNLVLAEAARRRVTAAGHQARLEACLEALRAAGGAAVSAVALKEADQGDTTLAQWKSAMAQARRQFKREQGD